MEAGGRLEACREAGEREKTSIVLFVSCENDHVSPTFVSSRNTYQSCLSKWLEKEQVSAPLSLFTTYEIRLSWGVVIKNNCAYCYDMKVSQLGALGYPFHLQMGKTHWVNSKAHLAAPFHCLLCNQVKSSSPEGTGAHSSHQIPISLTSLHNGKGTVPLSVRVGIHTSKGRHPMLCESLNSRVAAAFEWLAELQLG